MNKEFKAYIIASENNLTVLKDKLSEKYPTLQISGTNSTAEGIKNAINKQVINNYDVLVIVNQNFVTVDTEMKHSLSQLINTGGSYSASNLTIYFFCKDDNTEYLQNLKKLITNKNVQIIPYKDLNLSHFEQIIKEVATFRGQNKDNTELEVEKQILEQKISAFKGGKNPYTNRIFAKRMEDGNEDFSRLSKVREIISNHSKSSSVNIEQREYKDPASVLTEIQSNLFNRKEPTKEGTALVSKSELNENFIRENLKPEVVATQLRNISVEYDDYLYYMEDIKEVIENLKNSNEANKQELVVELMKEHSIIHKNAHMILADFLTKVAESSVEHITESINRDLQQFSELNDVDELVGGKLKEIAVLKENRENFKNEIRTITEKMHALTTIVRDSLKDFGDSYRVQAQKMNKNLIEYASDNNIILDEGAVLPIEARVLNQIQNSYNVVNTNVNKLIHISNATVQNFMQLVMKDEVIIEKQDETINILMTQKSKKILMLDNIVQVKSYGFCGLDNSGKTLSALSLATSLAKTRKVVLIDLNVINPSLTHYANATSQWSSGKTISLEEFVKLPASNQLHKQLPFSDGLTIIKPNTPISLTDFSKTVNTEAFAEQIATQLKFVMDFYDNVVFILPQDISEIKDILKHIGKVFVVTDTNPNNLMSIKKFVQQYKDDLDAVPVRYLLLNKMGKGLEIDLNVVADKAGTSLDTYSIIKVPIFTDAPTFKFQGKNPYMESAVISRFFNDIIKNV